MPGSHCSLYGAALSTTASPHRGFLQLRLHRLGMVSLRVALPVSHCSLNGAALSTIASPQYGELQFGRQAFGARLLVMKGYTQYIRQCKPGPCVTLFEIRRCVVCDIVTTERQNTCQPACIGSIRVCCTLVTLFSCILYSVSAMG